MGKFWPETEDLDWMEDAAIDQPAFFYRIPICPCLLHAVCGACACGGMRVRAILYI